MNRPLFLNLAGALILLAGISGAFVLHRQGANAAPEDDSIDERPDAPLSIQDSKRLSAAMEQNWGKAGNLGFSSLADAVGNRAHWPLILLGISAVAGLSCFFVADRLER
ncbi:MAG: hypothetical protein ACFUZC_09855 [Chthoniobacteraceae bacterium]